MAKQKNEVNTTKNNKEEKGMTKQEIQNQSTKVKNQTTVHNGVESGPGHESDASRMI
jgi:hypothetical protein